MAPRRVKPEAPPPATPAAAGDVAGAGGGAPADGAGGGSPAAPKAKKGRGRGRGKGAGAAAAAAEQNGDAGVVAAAATPAVPSFNAQLLLKLHNYIRDIMEHPAFEGITCGAPSKLGEGFAQQERRGECP